MCSCQLPLKVQQPNEFLSTFECLPGGILKPRVQCRPDVFFSLYGIWWRNISYSELVYVRASYSQGFSSNCRKSAQPPNYKSSDDIGQCAFPAANPPFLLFAFHNLAVKVLCMRDVVIHTHPIHSLELLARGKARPSNNRTTITNCSMEFGIRPYSSLLGIRP